VEVTIVLSNTSGQRKNGNFIRMILLAAACLCILLGGEYLINTLG